MSYQLFEKNMLSNPVFGSVISKVPGTTNGFFLRTTDGHFHLSEVASLADAVQQGGVYVALKANPAIGVFMLGRNAEHLASGIGKSIALGVSVHAVGIPKAPQRETSAFGSGPTALWVTTNGGAVAASSLRWHVDMYEDVASDFGDLVVFGMPSAAIAGFGILGLSESTDHPFIRFVGFEANLRAQLPTCPVRGRIGSGHGKNFQTVLCVASTGVAATEVVEAVLRKAVAATPSAAKNLAIKAANSIIADPSTVGVEIGKELYSHVLVHRRGGSVYAGEGPREVFLTSSPAGADQHNINGQDVKNGQHYMCFPYASTTAATTPNLIHKASVYPGSVGVVRATVMQSAGAVGGGSQALSRVGVNLHSFGPAFQSATGLGTLPMCYHPWVSAGSAFHVVASPNDSPDAPLVKKKSFVDGQGLHRPREDLSSNTAGTPYAGSSVRELNMFSIVGIIPNAADSFSNFIASEPAVFVNGVQWSGIPEKIGPTKGGDVLASAIPSMFYGFLGHRVDLFETIGYDLPGPDFTLVGRDATPLVEDSFNETDVNSWGTSGTWPGAPAGSGGRQGLVFRAVDLDENSFTQIGLRTLAKFDSKFESYI